MTQPPDSKLLAEALLPADDYQPYMANDSWTREERALEHAEAILAASPRLAAVMERGLLSEAIADAYNDPVDGFDAWKQQRETVSDQPQTPSTGSGRSLANRLPRYIDPSDSTANMILAIEAEARAGHHGRHDAYDCVDCEALVEGARAATEGHITALRSALVNARAVIRGEWDDDGTNDWDVAVSERITAVLSDTASAATEEVERIRAEPVNDYLASGEAERELYRALAEWYVDADLVGVTTGDAQVILQALRALRGQSRWQITEPHPQQDFDKARVGGQS